MKNLLSVAKAAKNKGDTVKQLKKAAKGAAKSKIKLWIWAGIGSFLLDIIIPLVLVATMFIPFSFCYQMLEGIGEAIQDGTLKLKSTTWDTWVNWFWGENGEQYEDYLISTYKRIDKEIYNARKKAAEGKDVDFDENDVYDKSAAAIGWVYSRLYSATMEPSTVTKWFDFGKSMFNSAITTKTQGKVLKPLEETVVDIYDPASKDAEYMDVAELRKKVFNEVITPYDIQAFDYVGGTLFDLLNFDMEEMRKSIAAKHESDIESKYNSETEEIHKEAIIEFLDLTSEVIDEAFTNTNWQEDPSANQYLKKTDNSFRFEFESTDIGKVWKIFRNAKLSGDSQKVLEDAYKVINKIYMVDEKKTAAKVEALSITKEDYDALINTIPYMKDILCAYVDSIKSLNSKEKEDIKKFVGNIHDTKNIGVMAWELGTYPTKANKLKTNTNEKIAAKELSVSRELTDEEFNALLKQKIKDLKLNRTWNAAETFRDALLELDDSGQIAEYYSLNLGAASPENLSINLKLLALLSPDIRLKNGELELTKIPVFLGSLSNAYDKMGIGDSSNYKFDKNDRLIVAGVSGGQNFITDAIKEIINNMTNYLEDYKEASEKALISQLDILKESELTDLNKNIESNKSIVNSSYSKLSDIPSTLKTLGKFDEVLSAVNNGSITLDLVNSAKNSFYSTQEYLTISPIKLGSVTLFYSSAEYVANSNKATEDLNAKYEDALSEFSSLIKKQAQSIIDDLAKIPTEGEFYKDETYFVKSDITTVKQGGYSRNLKSIGSEKNILKIQKYKNTIKEAVMLTAQKCYPEKVRELSGQGGGFTGTIQLGDIEIGTHIDNDNYRNAYRYIDYFIEYGNMYGVDPYLLLASAAQESRGQHDENKGDDGYGIMQIEQPGVVTTSASAYNHITKQVDYVDIPNKAAVDDVKDNIRVGAMIYANRFPKVKYNILAGIQKYNYNYALDTAIEIYAEEIGVTYEEALLNYSDTGWMKYLVPIHLDIVKYMPHLGSWESGKCGQVTCEHSEESGHYGDPYYISNVLRYYNPVDSGGPWVMNENSEKIQLISNGTTNNGSADGESTDSTAKYFKGKELINWKDYYTDTKVFEKVDKWYLSDLDESSEDKLETSLSQTIINAVQKYVTKPEVIQATNGLLNDTSVLANLIAKTYYVDTGFKPKVATKSEIEKEIELIGYKYISTIRDISSISEEGIDLSFVIYLSQFEGEKKDVAKQQVLVGDKNFDKFIQDIYLKDKESLTQSDALLTRIVRIITGDKDAKVDSYFSISSEESSSTGKIVDGRLVFYKQWLDAKNTFHETFNAEIDEKIERLKTDKPWYYVGPSVEQLELMKLPVDFTFEGAIADDTDEYIKDGLIGKLSLNLKDDTKVNELMVFRKDLTNTDNFSTTTNEPKYIVIHQAENTTGGASAKNQYSVYNGDRKSETHKSMHFSVDSNSIYQWLSEDISAIHLETNTTDVNNSNSIAIEYVATDGKVSDQLQWNLVALCKYLMHKYPSISAIRVGTHSLITEADCPEIMSAKSNKIFEKFKTKLIKEGLSFKFEEASQYSGDAKKVIEEALKHLGKPYVWAAKGPDSFDCSGFVQYVFATAVSKSVPAPTWTQMTLGTQIKREDLKPGDLIFFRDGDHVAIYIGDYNGVDSYIHAGGPTSGMFPTAQDKVMISPMTYDRMTSFVRIL